MKKNQDIKSYSGGVNIKTYCNINGVWRTVNSIKTIVNGITKSVVEPKVNIDGVWKDQKTYYVYIYHKENLYTTLSCYEGSSVTLPNVSGVQGYSTTNMGDKVYNNNQRITPTSNMSLYGIYPTEDVVVDAPQGFNYGGTTPLFVTIDFDQTITLVTHGVSKGFPSSMQLQTTEGYTPYFHINNIPKTDTIGTINGSNITLTYQVKKGDVLRTIAKIQSTSADYYQNIYIQVIYKKYK